MGHRRTRRMELDCAKPRRRVALAVAGALLLTACSDPIDPATVDLDLSAYPPCAEQPPPPPLPDIPGLILPASTEVFTTTELGPLTQVSGVVAMTPLQARSFYEAHPDLEMLSVEDERIETELLATDGEHRLFIKVQITCAGGSNITATVGDEVHAESLPRPAGAQPTG